MSLSPSQMMQYVDDAKLHVRLWPQPALICVIPAELQNKTRRLIESEEASPDRQPPPQLNKRVCTFDEESSSEGTAGTNDSAARPELLSQIGG